MNRITLSGRLTRAPELRALPSGDPVCSLRLAVDGMASGRQTGYIDVVSYGKSGEAAARELGQGWLVGIDGRVEHRTWQGKDGRSHEVHQVVGVIEFYAAPRRKNTNDSADEPTSTPEVADNENVDTDS